MGGAKDGKKRRGAKKKWRKWKGDEQKKRRGIPKKGEGIRENSWEGGKKIKIKKKKKKRRQKREGWR